MANKRKISLRKFSLFLVALFCLTFAFADAYADNITAQDLWLQSTANTRTAAQSINDQIIAQQAQQQATQTEQQQQMQQALETLQSQQKATLNNQTVPTTTSTFQAQPSTVTGTTNPWVKPNPWQNTQQNPYAGQQYGTTPASTGASTTHSTATTSPNNNAGAIYLNPNTQPSQQQNANPINIYK